MAPLINQSCFLLSKLCYKKPSKCNPKLTIWVECLTTEAKAVTTLILLKAITLPHRIMGATVGILNHPSIKTNHPQCTAKTPCMEAKARCTEALLCTDTVTQTQTRTETRTQCMVVNYTKAITRTRIKTRTVNFDRD